MDWIPLVTSDQLEEIQKSSQPSIIFKHSTRCPVSSMAKRNVQLEAVLIPEGVPTYYLDLIQFRDLSNAVAERWDVRHESPQLLLIHNNKCLYHASHNSISIAEVVNKIKEIAS